MYPGQLAIVSLPVPGPAFAVVTSPSLAPPPTVSSPPQAAMPTVRTNAATSAASARVGFLRSGLLSMAPHLLIDYRVIRLPHDVHVLRLPAERDTGASSGQGLPL